MIILKTQEEKKKLRESNRIVALVLREIEALVKPGVRTADLDKFAEELILKEGATPTFKGYNGFPASLCISVDEEIVHGIPSVSTLKNRSGRLLRRLFLETGYPISPTRFKSTLRRKVSL